MFTLTQIQYHTKVLSIIYPAAKISKSLQTSWMKIINSTTTKKKLQNNRKYNSKEIPNCQSVKDMESELFKPTRGQNRRQ